jgi:hypothetical protein
MAHPEPRHVIAPAASPQEAAAILAAVARFRRDTAPPARGAPRARSEWARTALLEATGRSSDTSWGR